MAAAEAPNLIEPNNSTLIVNAKGVRVAGSKVIERAELSVAADEAVYEQAVIIVAHDLFMLVDAAE